jgi:ribonuclease T1
MRATFARAAAGLCVALLLTAVFSCALARSAHDPAARGPQTVVLSQLPREARETVSLIQRGGPFPYERDGVVFGNFERVLPARDRGYYREYTVPTPGEKSRGARRIVLGRGGELYYTDDHARTFRRIRE